MGWFKQRRKIHVYQMQDGQWSASVGSISGTVTWTTKPTPVEAVEALRLRLLEHQLSKGHEIEVDW
jgi:hypothetical protein